MHFSFFVVKSISTEAAPEKVEVFVDDQRVLVDPGTTVLQVISLHTYLDGPTSRTNLLVKPCS